MSDYFDASAIVSIILREPSSDRVSLFLAMTTEEVVVSQFAVAEVSSAVSRLVRMRERTRAEAIDLIQILDDWVAATADIADIENSDFLDATDIVRAFELKLLTPDALHLTIARRLGARLVTLDGRLVAAAHAIGVTVINPAVKI